MAFSTAKDNQTEFIHNFCQNFESIFKIILEREYALVFYYGEDGDVISQLLENLQICWFTQKDTIEGKWKLVSPHVFLAKRAKRDDQLSEEEIKDKLFTYAILSVEEFEREWINIVNLLVVFLGILKLDSLFAKEFSDNWTSLRSDIIRLWERNQSLSTPSFHEHTQMRSSTSAERLELPDFPTHTSRVASKVSFSRGVPDMDMPLPLLTANKDRKWQICPEAADVLNGISAEMAVVAIVGKYRTGKSYLMNRLAGGNSGFGLGSTIQSETKGIWMWAKPHPQDKSKCLLLLDTEGLYDVEKGDQTNDMQLFTFAVLLSNCLVFNAVGNIDNVFVQELQLVSELTENIKVKEASRCEDMSTEFASYFPVLFVVLRDFFLELKLNGREISSDEYLENSLRIRKGMSLKDQQYNAPRECIAKFFPKRKCYVLPKPVTDDTRLRDLDLRPDTDLLPEFREKCQVAVDSILDHAKPMCIDGNLIIGPGFLHLVFEYVRAVNEGGVPCIESALDVMVEKECRRAYGAALGHYNKEMERRAGIHMPVSEDTLARTHEACQTEAVDVYRHTSVFDERGTHASQLEDALESALQELVARNDMCSRHLCQEALDTCCAPLKHAISSGVFATPGGHEHFMIQQKEAIDEYSMLQNLGPQKDTVLHDYLLGQHSTEQTILNADKTLSAQARAEAELQRSLRDQQEQRRLAEQRNERMRIENERQQRDHGYLVQQMLEDFDDKQQRLKREQDEKLDRQQREYRRLLSEGLEHQAAQHRKAMDRMVSDRREQEAREAESRRQLAEYQQQMQRIEENQRRSQEQQAREREAMRRQMEQARQQGEAERRRVEAQRLENEKRYQREQEELRRQAEQARASKKKKGCTVM